MSSKLILINVNNPEKKYIAESKYQVFLIKSNIKMFGTPTISKQVC
jgi:hypothetical protein